MGEKFLTLRFWVMSNLIYQLDISLFCLYFILKACS